MEVILVCGRYWAVELVDLLFRRVACVRESLKERAQPRERTCYTDVELAGIRERRGGSSEGF